MENETKVLDEAVEETQTEESEEKEEVNWEAKAKEAIGRAKRAETQLKKFKEAPEETSPAKPQKKEGFDYAEKAYLKSSGINQNEFDFVYEVMTSTGKTLDEVLEAKYFQSELKEKREAKASKEAIPSGTKRSASPAKDQIEHWLNKPFSEVPQELKREVLKARQKVEANNSKFSDRPIGNVNWQR